MQIGNIKVERGLLLAPMEGITDIAFRLVCRELGADIVYSEFVASEAIIRDAKKSISKMKIVDAERPVAVQIFGSRSEVMAGSAQFVESIGADFLDINYGCWVKKVVNSNSGAALLKDPRLMGEITESVVKSVSIPVTAKTRLGWDHDSINICEVARILEDAGVAALTIHCRTRNMGMGGEADWSWIARVKELVKIPIILNGDVKSPQDARRAFDETGCDAVMIGRAAVGNPFIFKRTREYLETGEMPPEPGTTERIEACLRHLELSIINKELPRGLNEFRKHYAGYLKGMRESSSLRQRLVIMDSAAEIGQALREYGSELEG